MGKAPRMEETRNGYSILVEKPEGKRPLGRTWRRWKDTIRIIHREKGWEVVEWIHLAKIVDRWWVQVNTVTNLRVQWKARNLLTS